MTDDTTQLRSGHDESVVALRRRLPDLPGITARLEHVRDLGADAVWLSPIYRSPMADFGYDIADHT